ncbi:MAG: DUF4034 domain-containing protein [Nitrospira sp.]
MRLQYKRSTILTLSIISIIGITFPLVVQSFAFAATPSGETRDSMPLKEKEYVLNLLQTRQFQQLDSYYSELQQRYEKEGTLNDWQLLVQYQPFYDTNPANEPLLTEWIAQYPESYSARLARGIYYRKAGEAKRGSEWISKTPRENLDQLSQYLDLATDDLMLSRTLTVKPIVSIVHLLNVTKHRDGDLGNRYWLEEANRIDSQNYGARRRYMLTLTPRWGGSYEDMYAFLQECRLQKLPSDHIRIYEAIIHDDRANMLRHNRRSAEALQHYRQALVFLNGIENGETIEALKGLIHSAKETHTLEAVSADIDYYLRLVPQDGTILSYRGWLREKQGRADEAFMDFKNAAVQGHAWSQFRIGQKLFYDTAFVTEQNNEGLSWIKKAAAQGYEPAQKLLQQVDSGTGTAGPK